MVDHANTLVGHNLARHTLIFIIGLFRLHTGVKLA
jgi:hypothetical protein